MTAFALLPDLPVQEAPLPSFADLHTLVPHLMDLYPGWDLDDLVAFLEEKTRRSLHPEDVTTLRTVYQRCQRLRREFEAGWGGVPSGGSPGAAATV